MPDPDSIPAWAQTGGLLAFAGAVWWEIRQVRPFMRTIAELLAVLRDRTERPRAPTQPGPDA
jgi:hypothetical protein